MQINLIYVDTSGFSGLLMCLLFIYMAEKELCLICCFLSVNPQRLPNAIEVCGKRKEVKQIRCYTAGEFWEPKTEFVRHRLFGSWCVMRLRTALPSQALRLVWRRGPS